MIVTQHIRSPTITLTASDLSIAVACRISGRQPTSADEINSFISAELPDTSQCRTGLPANACPCDDHRLYRIISSSMIHDCRAGRCYKAETPESERYCKYGYPFDVNLTTHINDQGRVVFMRRTAADALVVPYNRFLCLKYNAHSEVCCLDSLNFPGNPPPSFLCSQRRHHAHNAVSRSAASLS